MKSNLFMYEIDNITFDWSVTRKCTIIAIDHKLGIIAVLYKKTRVRRAGRLDFHDLLIKYAENIIWNTQFHKQDKVN